MTRTEAEQAVIATARAYLPKPSGIDRLRAYRALEDAVAALDALPSAAPEPVGEMVEVRALVFRASVSGAIIVREENWQGELSAKAFPLIATIRACVPLPVVPEIVGEVEG